MAKELRVDEAQMRVKVIADAARKELVQLKAEAKKVAKEMKGVTDETQKLNKKAELDKITARMDELKKKIGLTGMTLAELRKEHSNLKKATAAMIPWTQEWVNASNKIRAVKERIDEVTAAQTGAKGLFSRVKDFLLPLGIVGTIMAAAKGMINLFTESFHAYNEAATAEAKLLNALNGQQDVQERLIAQAKEIQRNTIYQDDQVVAAQAFLAAQKLNEEQIKKTIHAAVQLAAVTGEDLQTTTVKLAATYEGQLGRLGKLDDRFKNLTKEQLKNGAAIDLVNEKYKNFAETAAQTGEGPLIQMKNAWNDLMEEIGGSESGILNPFFDFLKNVIEMATVRLRMFRDGWTDFLSFLSGVTAATKVLFKDMGDVASATFGNIGKMMVGFFTLDANMIGEAVAEISTAYSKAGSDAAKAFREAYDARYAQLLASQKKKPAGGLDLGDDSGSDADALKDKAKKFVEIITGTAHEISESSKEHYAELNKQAQDYLTAREQIDDALLQSGLSEEQKEILAVMQKYDKLVELADQYGLDSTALRQAMEAELFAIGNRYREEEENAEKKKNDKILQSATKTWEEKIGMVRQYGEAVTSVLLSLGKITGKDLKFQKAAALAQIAIDAGLAVAMAIRQALKHTLTPADFAIQMAGYIATILTDIAIAKSLVNQAQVPAYAAGGVTEGGAVNKKQLAWFGEKGPEYVIPNWMLQDPGVANIAGVLEAIRTGGFAKGGRTRSSNARGTEGAILANEGAQWEVIRALAASVQRLNEKLDAGIDAKFDFDYYSKTTRRIERIRGKSGI